jgi:hypothetical protein
MMNSTSLTVQELKKALKKRGLSERGLKKELVERLDAAVSREEEGGEEEETNRKRGTKRKNDDGEEEEEEDEKRRKTSAPALPVLRRGRSRSKSVEPPPAASEEEALKKNNDAKPPLSSSALEKIDEEGGEEEKKKNTTKAAAMKEKMQKAKELMKKQKALAEKMKMKKMEAAGAGAKTTTTTTSAAARQPSTSAAQHAIEKARETAARLAALQHQQKKNRTATEGKFEKTGPAPVLRVNEKGQEVDENGKVIVRAKDYTATTKVNEKQKMREAFLQAEREVAMEEMRRRGDAAGGKRVETTKEDMIDPEIAVKQKHNRKKPSLQVSRVYSSHAHSFFSLFLLVGHMQGTLSYQSYITVT